MELAGDAQDRSIERADKVRLQENAEDADDEIPLLASVFSMDMDGFLDGIVGRLQRIMAQEGKELAKDLSCDAVGQVVRAILSHIGWHSNRVWTGITKLAQESKCSRSQVKRALAFLRNIYIMRRITGDEILEGPGSHQIPIKDRKNEKKMESALYDLSGLLPLLSGIHRKAVAEVLDGKVDRYRAAKAAPKPINVDEEFDDPFADPKPSGIVPPAPVVAGKASLSPAPRGTASLSPSATQVKTNPKNTDQRTNPVKPARFDSDSASDSFLKNASDIPKVCSPHDEPAPNTVQKQPDQAVLCNVVSINKPSPKQDSAGGSLLAPLFFSGPEMVPTTNRNSAPVYAHEEIPAYKRAHEAMKALGVDFPLRRAVIEAWGAHDAEMFAAFGTWRSIVGDASGARIGNLGGYLTNTFGNMLAKERESGRNHREWNEDFIRAFHKGELPTASMPVTPPPAPPRSMHRPDRPTMHQVKFEPSTLTEDERDWLTQAAMAEVLSRPHLLEKSPAARRMRERIFNQGLEHPSVRAAAHHIWVNKKNREEEAASSEETDK